MGLEQDKPHNSFHGGGAFPECDEEWYRCNETKDDKPLCHYEWVECAIRHCPNVVPNPADEINRRL